jgi:hypothetical protein
MYGSAILTGACFRCDENPRTRAARPDLRLVSRGKARWVVNAGRNPHLDGGDGLEVTISHLFVPYCQQPPALGAAQVHAYFDLGRKPDRESWKAMSVC